MKSLASLLIIASLLSGCASGTRFYTPGQITRPDGSSISVPIPVLALNADMDGGEISYSGYGHHFSITQPAGYAGQFIEEPILNKKGEQVGTRRTPITARMNHSNVLKTILEGAATIGGEVKTTAVTATAAGVIAPLVPAAAAAINP
jgi:hypothetical protein